LFNFFKDEEELRSIWSAPATRKKLLEGLSEKGFGQTQLAEIQRIIDAEKSDLFDMLAYIAYGRPPISREERAAQAATSIDGQFNTRQKTFLDFVLNNYVKVGVSELDQEKLTPLLTLWYNDSIADAIDDLGPAAEINAIFVGFQKFLYEESPGD
jgi:type I restriction enzyme R subunit